MKKIPIAETDIDAVAYRLEQIAPFCKKPVDPDLRSPAI